MWKLRNAGNYRMEWYCQDMFLTMVLQTINYTVTLTQQETQSGDPLGSRNLRSPSPSARLEAVIFDLLHSRLVALSDSLKKTFIA